MATYEDTETALLTSIEALAKAANANASAYALNFAAAANHLAEAYAWLRNPSQPHGGSAVGG